MDSSFEEQVTSILNTLGSARDEVSPEFVALLYAELKQLARSQMARQAADHTLQPTALVNEVWLRVRPEESTKSWESRRHFFRAAVMAMRSVLVDHARAKLADKRGGGARPISLDQAFEVSIEDPGWVLELEAVLEKLEREDSTLAEVVQLRFYAGLSHEEIAAHCGVSVRTVERRWRAARLWLLDRLGKSEA
jgi:RNA polymerase sigma factor (TIGR02999 family)